MNYNPLSMFKKYFLFSVVHLFLINLLVLPQDIPENISKLLESNSELLSSTSSQSNKQIKGEDRSLSNSHYLEDQKKEKSKIFGFDYFDKIPRSISATSDLPVPEDYTISLGDKIKIYLTGARKDTFTVEVGMDGSVILPDLGIVNIYGETLESAERKLKKLVELSYAGSDVILSLESLAAKKINIVGAIKNPGSYVINPFSTIISALAYSGGFEDFASLRNISVIRKGTKIDFDLYEFLIFGERSNDLNLQQGDTIIVNSTNKFIEILGSVNRPFIYEYKANETVNDLIYFAMGTKKEANLKKIAIVDLNSNLDGTELREISLEENILLNQFNSPLSLEVFAIEKSPDLKVRVIGPLKNQGYFEIPESGKLIDLVAKLDFTTDINPYLGVVQEGNFSQLFSLNDPSTQQIRLNKNYEVIFFSKFDKYLDSKIKTIIEDEKLLEKNNKEELKFQGQIDEKALANSEAKELDISELNKDMSMNSAKKSNSNEFLDEQFQINKTDLEEFITEEKIEEDEILNKNSIQLIKDYMLRIVHSGNQLYFPYFGKISADQVVEFLGLDTTGLYKDQTTFVAPLKELSITDSINKLNFNSEKFNSLIFRDLIDQTIKVDIKGEVNLPGEYILSPGTTLSDLYLLVDGIKDRADPKAVVFTRKSVKERNIKEYKKAQNALKNLILGGAKNLDSLDPQLLMLIDQEIDEDSLGRISGDLSTNSELINDFLLEDGDIIFVPKKIKTVSVVGEVLNPSSFIFDESMNLRNLISLAGGYNQKALKRAVYVIRSDGFVEKSKGVFSKNLDIMPGDTVVVPTDFAASQDIFSRITPITTTLSNLAFSAAAIDNLRRN